LITETEVTDAQKDLAEEITPQITELLKRAEQSLARLERKQYALKSKVRDALRGTDVGGVAEREVSAETASVESGWG
jgi:Spc19